MVDTSVRATAGLDPGTDHIGLRMLRESPHITHAHVHTYTHHICTHHNAHTTHHTPHTTHHTPHTTHATYAHMHTYTHITHTHHFTYTGKPDEQDSIKQISGGRARTQSDASGCKYVGGCGW